MKLLRYGPMGKEKPGVLDADGVLRDLSAVIPDIDPIWSRVRAEAEAMSAHDRAFVAQLVHGTRANLEAIDAQIAANSREWKVERMAAVDRNLTRMATYEMCFAEEKLTPNIAINEAVELAKKYGTDDSSRYVNGILGAIMKSAKSAE